MAIDSAMGTFLDARIPATLAESTDDLFSNLVYGALDASTDHSSAALEWRGFSLVAFETGFGDGSYPVFQGLSAEGRTVTVVVDCQILPWKGVPWNK